ncbi:MAG: hypothetical protein HOE19_00115 [Candidatus Komeilibacteria bacterium]|nr:hypothetical protein [Candidatus Komeilibacteria bacterium]
MSLIKRLFVFSLVFTTVLWSFGGLSVKAEGTYGAGSLLALEGVEGAAVYYIGSDDKKYVFPEGKTYATWYENFDDVVRVDVAELDMYDDGGAMTYRAGTKLVTHANTAKIYAVGPGGSLHWLPTAEVAEALYGATWYVMVQDVIPGYFSSSYVSGADLSDMYPNGTLLQVGEEMYYVMDGDVRPFADSDAFDANNFDYDNLIEVDDVDAYGAGESVTGEETGLAGFMPAESSDVDDDDDVVSTGDLTVSLASGTPVSRSIIADSTNSVGEALTHFSDFKFQAGSSDDAVVTNLKLTRTGISSDTDLDNVYLYNGMIRLAEGGSISSGVVTFNNAAGLFTVPAGTTMTVSVKADLNSAVSAGKTMAIGLASADMVTSGGSVAGNFPLTGNTMTFANVDDLGRVTVSNYNKPASADTSVDPDQSDFEVFTFNLQSGGQILEVDKLVLTEVGSIQVGDLTNFVLLAAGTEVGTAEMADDYTVTFDMSSAPVEITKGSTKSFSVRADVETGSTKTFYFSFQNSSDIMVRDTNYNVYVQPYTGGTWSILKPTTGNFLISSGSVTVSRATTSRTDNAAVDATNVTLATFDFKASGEDVKIKNLDVLADTTSTNNGGLDNGKIMVDGVQVGSTKDLTEDTDVNFTFGSSFIIPAGDTVEVTIVADIKTTTSASYSDTDTVTISVGAGSSNAQGVSSLTTSSVPSSDTAGNSITMTADSLTISKYTGYGDKTLVAGTNGAKLGSFVLNTGAASAVDVSSITVTLSTAEAATVTNLYLESDGVQFGSTKASPSTSNVFSDTTNIVANGAQVFDLYGDILSGADEGTWVASLTATGTSVEGQASVSATSADAQTITIGSGSMSASAGTHADSAVVLAGTTGNDFANFNFSALNEDYTIQELRFTIENNFATSTTGITLDYPTASGTATANGIFIASGDDYYATFTGLDMFVEADNEASVTVKIHTTTIASGGTSGASGTVTFVYNSGFKAVGSSGTTVSSAGSANLSGNTMYLRKSKPTFAKTVISATTPSSDSALFKFTVVADSLGDVDIKQLGFTVTTTGTTVTALKLYNTDTGLAITDTGVDADSSGYVKLLVGAVDDDVERVGTTTKNYEVRGTITGWGQSADEITVGFKQDVAAATNAAADTQNGSYYNVWSDRSATSHTTATTDWTNGYLIKEMTGSHTFSKA